MSTTNTAPAPGRPASLSFAEWAAEFGALFRLGWPLVIAQLAQIALLTTDVVMMGRLGPKYLAAGALANALFICIQLFGVGVCSAVAPLVAQALGAGDIKSVRRIVRQGTWVALIMVVVLFPIIWNIRPIYLALGQDPELSAMGETFIHYAVWLLVPAFQIVVLRAFLSAHGATRIILWVTLSGVVLNFFADYALMFGNWGFPRLELAGAGIATTMVNVLMLTLIVVYIFGHRRFRRYHVFARFFEPDWPHFLALWRIGLPIGLMSLAEVAMFTLASLLQGRISQDSVAAHAIALQLSSISFMVPLGLSQAATVRVGLAYGERNPEGVRKAGWTALAVALLFMGFCGIVFFLFRGPLVGLFLDPADPANAIPLTLAAQFMIVAALFQLFDGTQVTMAATLRGLSDTRIPLLAALLGYWGVGFPVAWLLGFPAGLQGVGIWIGLAAGLAATGLILVARFAMRDRLGLSTRVAT